MPKFLEDDLQREYGNNPRAIYGTLNKIGAMHGNKVTAKGKQMEAEHDAKVSGGRNAAVKRRKKPVMNAAAKYAALDKS
jgi:hypothetical protein